MLEKKYLVRTVLYLLISYVVGYIYIDQAHQWIITGKGILTFNPKIYWIELPLFAIFSSLFYFPSVKNGLIRNLIPLIPALILYSLFDTFYNYLGRVATPSDFENLTGIFSFSYVLAIGLIVVYSLIPLSIYVSIKLNKIYTFRELRISLISRFFIIIASIILVLSPITKLFHANNFNHSVWAQEDTVRENGRFNSAIFYALQELNNLKQLEKYSQAGKRANVRGLLYPNYKDKSDKIKSNKNVHIIVMESFIDPRLITELNLPTSFISQEIVKYLYRKKNFSHVLSSIYGGGTAQVEFELLTGIKALSKVNQIEFNTMQGNKLNAFLQALSEEGYFSNAMVAPSSEFFNSKRAYKSLGFDNVDYLQENQLLVDKNDSPIFDGNLFDHNIQFLKKYNKNENKPIVNYVLGMYGHLPFRRNYELRPDIINPNHSDDRLNRISNQFYYRTEALANYLKQLIDIDPNSIIFVTSDHLPSVLSSEAHYKLDNKINIALMINNGETIDINNKHHYQIPWLIWDIMHSSTPLAPIKHLGSRQLSEQTMDELYFTALSETLKK